MNKYYGNLRLATLLDGDGGGAGGATGGATGGGGGATANWYDTLPQDLRQESITKFKSVEELARGYTHAQTLIGAKRLPAPTDKWGDNDWANLYKELGRPETPDGYKTPELKLPEGVKLDDAKMKKANEALHRAGLTPKQHEAVLKYYGETLGEAYTADEAARTAAYNEGVTALKGEWGDKFDANLDVAKSVMKKFGSPELLEKVSSNGMGNDPAFIKALVQIGSSIMEDKTRMGNGSGLQVMDSTRALQEINALKADSDFQKMLGNASVQGHKEAVARWTELHQKAYQGKHE